MKAFHKFKEIQELKTNEAKLREWLKDYEGLNFAIGRNKKDLIYWKKDKEKYVYSDKLWDGWYCLDFNGNYLYAKDINKIQRHKQRLVIEFDDKGQKGNKAKEKIKQNIEEAKQKLESLSYGYIESTHKGASNYIWIEFNRDLTTQEAKDFLKWIAPVNSEIDLNFTNDNFRFPVLFAEHWKYKGNIETPINFFEGNQISLDNLGLNSSISPEYETYKKQDLDVWTIKDYEKYKPDKDFLVRNRKYPKSRDMHFGDTSTFKSTTALHEAIAIASGKKVFGKYKTKKKPVLYLSAEDSIEQDKDLIYKIRRGLGLRKKDIPFYVLPAPNCDDLLNLGFKEAIFNFIKENGIEVLYLDTINPLSLSIDDNSGREVTKLFKQFIDVISHELNCNVTFMMHTDKARKNFLGSTKWKANSDSTFRFERKEEGKGFSTILEIYNEKNRRGEKPKLKVEIEFSEKKIVFNLLEEGEPERFQYKKKMSQLDFFIIKLKSVVKNKNTERKEIYKLLKSGGVIFKLDANNKNSTLERAIKTWREEKHQRFK